MWKICWTKNYNETICKQLMCLTINEWNKEFSIFVSIINECFGKTIAGTYFVEVEEKNWKIFKFL